MKAKDINFSKLCELCFKNYFHHVKISANIFVASRFCSRACWRAGHIPHNKGKGLFSTKNCLTCNTRFTRPQSLGVKTYCSWKCAAFSRRGHNAYQWQMDRAAIDENKRRHWSSEYRRWRTAVFQRDNYKCKISNGSCGAKIEAHHILPWRDYRSLRFNPNNGITLCLAHHPRKRAEEKRLSPYFQSLVSVSED